MSGPVVLLLVTMFVGNKVFGSTRWIKLAGFTLQTSEFVKIVLILLVARYLTDARLLGSAEKLNGEKSLTWADLGKLGALVALPMFLVMKQPDLGTALTYVPILVGGRLDCGFALEISGDNRRCNNCQLADRLSFS